MIARPVRILMVEDDAAHAEIARRNLESFQVANELHHLSDGQQALDYLTRTGAFAAPAAAPRPDLILLDLRLPKVDGLEVLERLKDDGDLCAIPVVVLTTSDAARDIAAAYAQGAASFLTKPVEFTKFVELMDAFGLYWLRWNRFPVA